MIADAISQLERREGMLPLSVEDRPRLSALLAAEPELVGAIREAHALASRHFPTGSDMRLRVVRYTDTPEAGDQVVAEVWVDPSGVDARTRLQALDRDWLAKFPDPFAVPVLITVKRRPRGG